MTIWANVDHVFVTIAGRDWGTSDTNFSHGPGFADHTHAGLGEAAVEGIGVPELVSEDGGKRLALDHAPSQEHGQAANGGRRARIVDDQEAERVGQGRVDPAQLSHRVGNRLTLFDGGPAGAEPPAPEQPPAGENQSQQGPAKGAENCGPGKVRRIRRDGQERLRQSHAEIDEGPADQGRDTQLADECQQVEASAENNLEHLCQEGRAPDALRLGVHGRASARSRAKVRDLRAQARARWGEPAGPVSG